MQLKSQSYRELQRALYFLFKLHVLRQIWETEKQINRNVHVTCAVHKSNVAQHFNTQITGKY